ncbi:hypothetical protein KM043_009444 [Ampulex compressa]|nr:hypothetical protein KM043_009444 [Ampulex compressa]
MWPRVKDIAIYGGCLAKNNLDVVAVKFPLPGKRGAITTPAGRNDVKSIERLNARQNSCVAPFPLKGQSTSPWIDREKRRRNLLRSSDAPRCYLGAEPKENFNKPVRIRRLLHFSRRVEPSIQRIQDL